MAAAKDLLEGKRILLVDDEPDVLDSLEDLLPMCETVKASNFKEAKDYLETEYFDLAILDIMGVEGYQLLEIANQRKVTAVMLTAHALSPDNVIKSYKEGAASYLPKEEMVNIASFLTDVFEAQNQGRNTWIRWYDRLGSFFEKKFGSEWQDDEKEFWEKFPFY
ncbi:MAG: response regulator [Deltaproteobacteria bacterium]|jgi:DNA-binding NtrC family response regulator|nr:response regulator [Deltaproteobacteria bacterium]